MNNITPNRWGRDHWSLLAYIETRVVDHRGMVDERHLRLPGIEDKHGTRLRGGEIVAGHTDLDVIDDLERFGYVINLGSGINPLLQLTDYGWQIVGEMRRYRANGGKSWESFFSACLDCSWLKGEDSCPKCHSRGVVKSPEVGEAQEKVTSLLREYHTEAA